MNTLQIRLRNILHMVALCFALLANVAWIGLLSYGLLKLLD